jgi:hypothetical protein
MRILQSVIDHIVQHVQPPGTVDESLQSGRLSTATFNDNRLKTHHAREHSFSAQLRVYASVIIWQRLKKKIQQWEIFSSD